jgi:hypothetical protein
MSTKTLGLLAIMLMTGPMVAQAQTETLDYQGYVMGGTSTTMIVPVNARPFQSAPVSTTATFDASVTYSGSLAQNDVVIDSYQINLTANYGTTSFGFQDLTPLQNSPFTMNGLSLCTPGGGIGLLYGCVTLTGAGAITGATFNFIYTAYHGPGPDFSINIGPNGDAFSEEVYGLSIPIVSCSAVSDSPQATYVGSASASPCTMNLSNPTAGVWTAPEIDTATAGCGLTLLLGGTAVLRGRRKLLGSQG